LHGERLVSLNHVQAATASKPVENVHCTLAQQRGCQGLVSFPVASHTRFRREA